MKSRSQTESGFTLIELVLVFLIMASLAGIAMPFFQNQVEKSRLTELALRVDAMRVAFRSAQELGNPAIYTFTSGSAGVIPPELSSVPLADSLRYPNIEMALISSADQYQQFAGGSLRPYLALWATNETGAITLRNFSDVMPESSWAWWMPSVAMVIPMLDSVPPSGGGIPPSGGNPGANPGGNPGTGTPAQPGTGTPAQPTPTPTTPTQPANPGTGTANSGPGNSGLAPGHNSFSNGNCIHPGNGHSFGRCNH